jgi:hypothetical protein
MPLIEMTSDLTSLRFGRDRRGGASSGQPYFTKDIPGRLESIDSRTTGLGTDFLIRGGALSAINVKEDAQRLGRFFTDLKSPNGLLFTAKQNLLARQNPKTGSPPKRGYLPTTTLAQAAVNPLGIHLSPVLNGDNKYITKTREEYNTSELGVGNKNRLLLLYETNIITPKVSPNPSFATSIDSLLGGLNNTDSSTGVNAFQSNLDIFGISPDPTLLFQYGGGPNAILGGKTSIRKDTGFNTSEGFQRNAKFTAEIHKFLVYTPDLIINKSNVISNIGSTGFGSKGITNFQRDLLDPSVTGVSETRRKQLIGEPTNYTEFNRVETYGEGDPGKKKPEGDRSVYYTTNLRDSKNLDPNVIENTFTVDSVNATPLYVSERVKKEDAGKKSITDIVKFNIGVIDLDSAGSSNPPKTTWVHFKSYITSFTDNYGAEWQGFKYMGRGNQFYRYKGFTRTISMGFDIAVHSKYEQAFVYDKLNYLASVCAPNYSEGGFMRGNIIKLTVGDYLNNQYGFLTSLNFSIPTDSTWDIGRGLDGKEDPNSLQLPHRISVGSFGFTPVHDFVENTVKRDYTSGRFSRPDHAYISLGNENEGYDATYSQRQSINNSE